MSPPYLTSDPCIPMRAYAYRVQSLLALLGGDRKQAGVLDNQATALDPYVSQIAGVPEAGQAQPPFLSGIMRLYQMTLG